MNEIKEQKEIISEPESQPIPLTTSDQVEKLVSDRVDKIIYDKLNKLEQKMNDRIEVKETKTTEILAIFITLFTFISVNVSIFTRVSDVYTAVWFMSLMTICSIIIVGSLFALMDKEKKWKWIMIIVGLVLIIALLLLAIYWNPNLNNAK